MTSRENIQRLFERKRPERVGLFESFWKDTMKKWVTQGYPTKKTAQTVKRKVMEGGREIEKEVVEELDEPVDPVEQFHFDMEGVGGWFDMLPLRGFSETLEETSEWIIKRNGAGAALKEWKNKSGTPEHVDFRMTSREVWERDYRPHMLQVDRARVKIQHAINNFKQRREQNLWTYYGHLFIWENMRRSLGDICLYESMLLDPAWIHDYNRVHTDFYKAHYRILFEEAGIPDGVWMFEDLGYNKGLFCSPRTLSELIFPYYKEIIEFFHSYGLPVILHSCGSQREALPLIVEAGFDGLNPMEVAAGNKIFDYAEKYGDKLVFVGGFDKRILDTHDRALIRSEVAKFMRGMKERGARFVFASDHSISTNADYGDYLALVEAFRENMAY